MDIEVFERLDSLSGYIRMEIEVLARSGFQHRIEQQSRKISGIGLQRVDLLWHDAISASLKSPSDYLNMMND